MILTKKDNAKLLDVFVSICYCGFLDVQSKKFGDCVPTLCIHCKTLEELFIKDVLDVPKDYEPKTLRLKNKLMEKDNE